MNQISPTWLYIKQHNITNLKYFGKTTQKDPSKYRGSGLYWKEHLRVHGNHVTTIWCELFENEDELVLYATKFSTDNNIATSEEWANLKPENGKDGFTEGHKYAYGVKHPITSERLKQPEYIAKMREHNRGNTYAKALKGYKETDEHKRKKSEAMKGLIRGPQTAEHIKNRCWKKSCPFCNREITAFNFTRHITACKTKMPISM